MTKIGNTRLALPRPTAVDVVSNTITVTGPFVIVNSGTVTTINYSAANDSSNIPLLVIQAADTETVVISDGVNIALPNGQSITLNSHEFTILIWDSSGARYRALVSALPEDAYASSFIALKSYTAAQIASVAPPATGLTYNTDDDRIAVGTTKNVTVQTLAEVQTTDATQTTAVSIAVGEAEGKTIRAKIFAAKSDYSAAIGGHVELVVRRATGGNVTLVGSVDKNEQTDGTTPSFTADVDTGSQTARIRVTGIAAETWNWRVEVEVLLG